MKTEILKQLLDELATFRAIADDYPDRLAKAQIMQKIGYLENLLELLLTDNID